MTAERYVTSLAPSSPAVSRGALHDSRIRDPAVLQGFTSRFSWQHPNGNMLWCQHHWTGKCPKSAATVCVAADLIFLEEQAELRF